MRLLLVCSIVVLVGAAGCTRTAEEHDAAPQRDMGTPSVDVGHDAPATACTTAAQCDDHIPCTVDDCVIGNVCSHTAVNGSCNVAAGEHCDLALGCTTMTSTTCTQASDCDDHVFCNGDETCVLNHCYAAPGGRNCDDGNACTVDSCDETAGSCSYMTTCDSGIVTHDAGPTCTAFVAPDDFNGTYGVVPGQSQACGGGTTYNVSEATLVVSGTNVAVTLGTSGGIVLDGTITGSSFTATGTHGSGTYTLTGSFACRERFMGHWTATVSGFGCSNQDVDVRGSRR